MNRSDLLSTGSVYASDQAIIVHVNEFDRLATLRNARSFSQIYLP